MCIHHQLSNGLHVVIDARKNTPLAVCNLLYHVGAAHDQAGKTGLAHFFEHLMFGPTKQIPDQEAATQQIGGSSNAYTSFEVTNYYTYLPAAHIEQAIYLEASRMGSLLADKHTFDTQKKVVLEEFQETTRNTPYGDAWQILLQMVYGSHPYGQMPIGRSLADVKALTPTDVERFKRAHYQPNNGILSVVGGVDPKQTMAQITHWFKTLTPQDPPPKALAIEPPIFQKTQKEARVIRQVPVSRLYIAYPMHQPTDPSYLLELLWIDILSNGEASRLYDQLVLKKKICTDIYLFPSETLLGGCCLGFLQLAQGVDFKQVASALQEIIETLCTQTITAKELQKVCQQWASDRLHKNLQLTHIAEQHAFATLFGDPSFFEKQLKRLAQITPTEMRAVAQHMFGMGACHLAYEAATAN